MGIDEEFELDNKTYVDQMRDNFTEMYGWILSDDDGNIRGDVNEEFFQEKLNPPYMQKMITSSYMNRTTLMAKEMLKMLDKDGDDEKKFEEWVEAAVKTFMATREN
jgi:hypothetical protein